MKYSKLGGPQLVKSAIEIALERSAKINVDPEQIRKIELKKVATKFLNEFYDNSEYTLIEKLGICEKEERGSFLELCEQILLGNIEIPVNDKAHVFVARSVEILLEIKGDQAAQFLNHIGKVLEHYKMQKNEILERLKQESGSTRERLQSQLRQQLGANVSLPPDSDPNYLKTKEKMLGQLSQQYCQELEYLKNSIRQVPNIF